MAKRIQGITISIDGETRGLDKALSDVNKQSRDLQKELNDIQRLLKFDPGNVEALAQKQQLLAQQVENTTERLNRLRAAQTQVEQQFQRGEIGEDQYRAFRREIQFTETQLGKFKSQLSSTQQKVNTFGQRMKQAGNDAKQAGRDIATSLGTAGAAGAAAVGSLVIGMQEYNQDLARLRTNAAMAGRDLGLVEEAFQKITVITGETDSAVETLSNILATGFADNQLAEVINQINGAAIKFSDTLKTEGIAEGIQETFATGEAVGPFAELLERSGMNLDDFNKKLQAAKKEGQGTQFILQTMAEQGFGKITEKYRELNPEVQKNAEAQAEFQKSLADLAIVLTPLVQQVTEFLTKVTDWAEKNPELAETIAVVAGALAVLSPIISVIALLFGAVSATVLVVIGVIAALIAIGILLYKNWDEIKAKAKEIWGAIKEWLKQTWENIKQSASEKWEAMKNAVSEKMESARKKIKDIWNQVMNFFKNIDLFQTGKDIIQGLINGIGSLAKRVYSKAQEIADGIKSRIKSALKIGSPSRVMEGYGEDTVQGFINGIQSALGSIRTVSNQLATTITTPVQPTSAPVATESNRINNITINNYDGFDRTGQSTVAALRRWEWLDA